MVRDNYKKEIILIKIYLGIWGLMEIKLAPDNPNIILSFKSRVMEVAQPIFQVCFSSINIIQMTHKLNILGL